jgi:uncharacterized protein (TIGR02444 family)
MQPAEPASEPGLELEGPQWRFALDLYQRPAVSKACLLLQDHLGVDITLLLFVLFVAKRYRIMLDTADLENLDDAIAAWRREVIWPLRSIRRRIKAGPDPAPGPATEGLRKQIIDAEIHAEQIELAILAQRFDRRRHAIGTGAVDIAHLLDRLASFFGARSANPHEGRSAELQAALKTIAGSIAHSA